MARAGDVIENPINGERLRFVQTAHDTAGRCVRFESVMRPGGCVGPEHVHTSQSSHFEVVGGTARFRVGGKLLDLGEGQTLTVLAGTPHRFWSSGPLELRMMIEFRPALRTETLFETFFGLARDGKVRGDAIRNPLQGAVVLDEFFVESHPTQPAWVLRLRRMLAPVGRWLGYRAVYARYSGSPDLGQAPTRRAAS